MGTEAPCELKTVSGRAMTMMEVKTKKSEVHTKEAGRPKAFSPLIWKRMSRAAKRPAVSRMMQGEAPVLKVNYIF